MIQGFGQTALLFSQKIKPLEGADVALGAKSKPARPIKMLGASRGEGIGERPRGGEIAASRPLKTVSQRSAKMKPFSLVAFSQALFLASGVAQADDLQSLEILQRGYPRAFFFRVSESMAAGGQMSFSDWEQTFLPLNGIMGKCLDEEVPGRSETNIEFFTRYKKDHPEKVVLLHLNGNGTDPRFEAQDYFAGHWLYYSGCTIAEDVPDEPGEATIHVEDTSLFKVNMGRYQNTNEDLGVCRLSADGKPDWSHAEQVQLLSIDPDAKTLTVRRGCFGTRPLAFSAGQSYIAAHGTRGPWGSTANLIWLFNYSTVCPKDSRGRTCNDVELANLARWFGPGGPLASFDGLEFDAAPFSKGGRESSGRGFDCDADGKPDNGYVDGVNVFGIGVYQLHQRLREILGDGRLILADGQGAGSQRSFGLLNGIESEGWPILSDSQVIDWSGGLNRHFFWRENAREPKLNYINHKFRGKGDQENVAVPFHISRLVLAVAQLTDSAVTFSTQPPKAPNEQVGIWDELRMGAENRMNWLGMPVAETIRLGRQSPDLLNGAGTEITPDFVSRWESENASVAMAKGGKALGVSSLEAAESPLKLTFRNLAMPEGDLLILCNIWAQPRKGYPEAIPRLIWLGCEGAGQLAGPRPPRSGAAVRGQPEGPLDTRATGAKVEYKQPIRIGKETHEGYGVHPPYNSLEGPGYVFWERDIAVPPAPCALEFYTGLDDQKNNSDGIVFSVIVKAGGEEEKVFENWHKDRAWEKRSVDLSRWAGRSVTLRFVADSGPNDSSTADHGAWGDVAVTGGGGSFQRSPYTSGRIMAFANSKPFPASFYFRDAGPAVVDLTLEIEGTEPVFISDFTVHNAPDAMAREFEHGVVLANPSMHDYVFDLATLFPNAKLRRFRGNTSQDPEVNNGEPVGATVTLGERDGLFLVRE